LESFSYRNLVYLNTFDDITENVESIRVKVLFDTGEQAFLNIDGYIKYTNTERNPFDFKVYNIGYEIIIALDVFRDFISSKPEWIVDENNIYYNTEVNKIKKIEIIETQCLNKTFSLFTGVHKYDGERYE